MVRSRILESVVLWSLVVSGVRAQVTPHRVVPLNNIPSEQWIEVVSGDPGKAGSAFVLQYWVRKADDERFWATAAELRRR